MTETTKPASSRWRQALWLVVRLLIVAGIFYFIFRTTDLSIEEVIAEAGRIRWWLVGVAFVIWVIGILVASYRWKVLLDVVRPGVNVMSLFAFNLVGIFYAQFLPGMVSGDVVKGYYLARDSEEKVKVMSSALMDRFLGIGVNGLLGLGALAASPLAMQAFELNSGVLELIFGIVIVGLLVAYGLVRFLERFESRFPRLLKSLFEPVRLYAHHPVSLLGAASVSVLYFVVWTFSFWALAYAVRLDNLGFAAMLLVLAVVNVAQFLPISVNGAGVREAAVVLLLSAYGIQESVALVFALLIPITGLGLALMGGILVLTNYRGAKQVATQ